MLGGWDRMPDMGGATPSGRDGADDIPDERGDNGIPDGHQTTEMLDQMNTVVNQMWHLTIHSLR